MIFQHCLLGYEPSLTPGSLSIQLRASCPHLLLYHYSGIMSDAAASSSRSTQERKNRQERPTPGHETRRLEAMRISPQRLKSREAKIGI